MGDFMTRTVQADVLIAGNAQGPTLVLEESLSFWGGFDSQTGKIIDTHHPQYGETVRDRVLFIPSSRGSAGTPGGIAETLRNGSGPCAFVLGKRDVNISVGVLVANRLYDLQVPVIEIPLHDFELFSSGDEVHIRLDGRLILINGPTNDQAN
jgi:predicted aconitase with swiveling domain